MPARSTTSFGLRAMRSRTSCPHGSAVTGSAFRRSSASCCWRIWSSCSRSHSSLTSATLDDESLLVIGSSWAKGSPRSWAAVPRPDTRGVAAALVDAGRY
eukprot:scaffold1730_cov117-Isochrysis_galbana.AAC.5